MTNQNDRLFFKKGIFILTSSFNFQPKELNLSGATPSELVSIAPNMLISEHAISIP